MKRVLTISIVANLVLGSLLACLTPRGWKTKEAIAPTPVSLVKIETATNIGKSLKLAATFRWAQLESTNYRTYTANLRSIGCPEQTIRDIITADVHSLYASRFRELDSKGIGLMVTRLPDQIVSRNLELEFHNLSNEVAAVIAAALSVEETGMADSSGPRRSSRSRIQDLAVSMPLVFQDLDEKSVKLDTRQREVIADLRAKFQQEIGGPNQDPNDPAYRERWLNAQRNCDDMLAGMLGGQFFVEYQLHAGVPPSNSQN